MTEADWSPGEEPPEALRALESNDRFWQGWSDRLRECGYEAFSFSLYDGGIGVKPRTVRGVLLPFQMYHSLYDAFRDLTRDCAKPDLPLPRPSRVERAPDSDIEPAGR